MCIPLNPLKSSGAEVGLHFIDEPINALDDVSVEKVHDILEEQKKRGAVIIIACHDKEELDQLSDEIIEISDGRIINKTC